MKTLITLLIFFSSVIGTYQFNGCASGSFTYEKCWELPQAFKIIDNELHTVCGVVTVEWSDIWKFDFVAQVRVYFHDGRWVVEGIDEVKSASDNIPVVKTVVNAENVELKIPVTEP